MQKPRLGFWGLWNISFGFFGIQIGFALQNANVSRIFQTLGASIDELPILWIAGPVTGLLVQPVIGYLSDRTWTRLGRRRPFFLLGALLASAALFLMPNSSALWMAAGLLWILDASINISMEPFRAFVGDMLDESQHTAGYAFQTAFIGTGAVAASLAPLFITEVLGVSNVDGGGGVPLSVRYAFYAGGVALLGAVLWTVLTTREHSPEAMAAFERREGPAADDPVRVPGGGPAWIAAGLAVIGAVWALTLDNPMYVLGGGLMLFGLLLTVTRQRLARGGAPGPVARVLSDLAAMPATMRQLALVQFFSWSGLFILWIFTTPIVTRSVFGATDTTSAAYNDGADWVGVLFAVYNGIAALWAFAMPALVHRIGARATHMAGLVAGALGFAGFLVVRDPWMLMVPMIGIGIAWASILTMPYAMLVSALPPRKLGLYMGLFNIFIVLPQLIVSTVMGTVSRLFFAEAPALVMLVGAGLFLAGAAATLRDQPQLIEINLLNFIIISELKSAETVVRPGL